MEGVKDVGVAGVKRGASSGDARGGTLIAIPDCSPRALIGGHRITIGSLRALCLISGLLSVAFDAEGAPASR